MGLSIAISGGIITVVLVVILGIIFSVSYQINTVSLANTDAFEINNSLEKTKMDIISINAASGNNVINFDLINIGSEKLWNYGEFDLIITYDADIAGVKTLVTEKFTYNSAEAFQDTGGAGGLSQFARPDETISITDFTVIGAPTAHEALDEVIPNGNTDYISGIVETATITVGLNNLIDPQVSTGHVFRYNASVINGLPPPERVLAFLFQGAVEIASSNPENLDGTYTTYTTSLSGSEADSITDYTDLRILLLIDRLDGGGEIRITQTEFEVPGAGGIASLPGLLAKEWAINKISNDILDSLILNTQEEAQIVTTLSYPIFANGFLQITLSSDNGRVESDSITVT